MQGNRTTANRPAFTVIELMVVISIIALLAAMAASALSNAAEMARAQRTRAIIDKIDQLVMEKWDSYRTRAVPYSRGANPRASATNRLNVLREIQRMELPERVTDVINYDTKNSAETTATGTAQASLHRGYVRKVNAATGGSPANWSDTHEGSECLYLILSSMKDGDKSALDFFTPGEIGDTDGDGMPEILDAWGQPIAFLRWAPGYVAHRGDDDQWGVAGADDDNDGTTDNITEALWSGSDDQPIGTKQTPNAAVAPDPFDPIKVGGTNNYVLKPLIFSPGPDGGYDVNVNVPHDSSQPSLPLRYTKTSPANNPYHVSTDGKQSRVGDVGDMNGDGEETWRDNITNHETGNE